jgi:aryl-alcohol dehydrogenase-like predicted oxidoreductase
VESYAFLRPRLTDEKGNEIVGRLEPLAAELGCTLAQLALAWCLKNRRVSTVITGATRVAQVQENMKALDVAGRLTPEVLARIDAVIGSNYD